MNRDAELFNVLKEGIKQEIYKRADNIMGSDCEAQNEIKYLDDLNPELRGSFGFDSLSDRVTNKLTEEAKDELENDLQDVFQDDNNCLQVLVKIIRGLV